MKVQVSKRVLRGFHRRALKKYPLEYIETIFGFASKQSIRIVAFYPIEHEATKDDCQYEVLTLEEQQDKEDAPEGKMVWLGSIHSHPDSSFVPSSADWETAREAGELVFGIVSILPQRKSKKKKIKVAFYCDPLQELEITD